MGRQPGNSSVRSLLLRVFVLGLAAAALAFASGCKNPDTHTRSVDDSPAISISGAPVGAILVVDGIAVGAAADYSQGKALQVLPGRHVVVLRAGGQVIASREVFVDAQGIKTIDFTGSFP